MRAAKVIHVVSCHAMGEVGDVIVGGVAPPPGDTIRAQRDFIATDGSRNGELLSTAPDLSAWLVAAGLTGASPEISAAQFDRAHALRTALWRLIARHRDPGGRLRGPGARHRQRRAVALAAVQRPA